jgi:hypothetical protein
MGMINLLPKEAYASLHASRHNVLLLRFIFTLLFVFISTIVVAIGTFLLINNQETMAKTAQSDSEAKIQKYNKAEKDSKEFATNLKIAQQILAKNISYTTILANIAQALPNNTIVDTLTLNPSIINKPTQLLVHAKSYEDGVLIKDTLNNSNIAKDASLLGINYETEPAAAPDQPPVPASPFPYAVSLSVTFTDKLLEKKEATK